MATKRPVRSIPRKRKPKSKRRVFLTILMILLMLFLLCCLLGGGYVMSVAKDLPEITMEDLQNAQTGFVYDQTGVQIAELHGGENRISVALSEMPQHLIDAVIASEDIRFYQHDGVDFRGVMRALFVDIIDTIKAGAITFTEGASTITMQLTSHFVEQGEGALAALEAKLTEMLLAIQFEKNYDKDEILYYYLNEIYMGGQIYGMQAASEYYFNKDVSEINLQEAALLVAILRAPAYYSPYDHPDRVLPIRNTVLNSMIIYKEDEYAVTAEAAKATPIEVYEGATGDEASYAYPWFVDHVVEEAQELLYEAGYTLDKESDYVYTAGLRIYTTLDTHVQDALESAYANPENFPESATGDIVESAMAIVEPRTGQIKGMVGGRVYAARRGYNRADDLIRSPGSTIKPLVTYGPAIELGYGAGTVIDDSPVQYGTWSPNNDDHTYSGRISLREAVVRSRNVCAVKLFQLIGTETGWSYGVKMGLNLTEGDSQNLSLTLGGTEEGVSPLQMAGAFATFANEGIFIEPHSITRIVKANGDVLYEARPDLVEVFSPAAAYIMTDVLTSAVNYGTGTGARISGWQVAGKTGTNGLPSEDPDYRGRSGTKDAWFCGYTTALAGAVWMGYDWKTDDDGNLQYLSNVYGGSYPARLFRTVMENALQNYENRDFERPEGVSSSSVDKKTGDPPSELTPAEYVGGDLIRSGFSYSGDGTKWQMVEVCTDTSLLATAFCPNKVNKVFLSYEEGKKPSEKVADYALYMPSLTCSTHTTYQSGLISVYVCTDPQHNGVTKLANIAARGSSGGCPDEYVTERFYALYNMPTAYCELEGHQVSGESVGAMGGGGHTPSGPNDATVPSTPSGLSGERTDEGVFLTWNGSEHEDISYIIDRADSASGSSERVQVFSTEYLDTDVREGVTYTYRVYALNDELETYSDWSSSLVVEY